MPDRGRAGSLEEFLRERPARAVGSWCCQRVPRELMAQIEAYVARQSRGIRWSAIVEWLRAEGVADATRERVRYHFERGHVERADG